MKNFFLKLFGKLKQDAAPLLDAAEQWARAEGLAIVREVEAEIAGKTGPELQAFINGILSRTFGVLAEPVGGLLSSAAIDLAITALAREKAKLASGKTWRTAVLNAGIEEALLLLKGQSGDTATAPTN